MDSSEQELAMLTEKLQVAKRERLAQAAASAAAAATGQEKISEGVHSSARDEDEAGSWSDPNK